MFIVRKKDTMVQKLHIPLSDVRSLLVNFIREELSKSGFQKGVLGLSGGLDSAVVASLAAEALGPGNLLCLCMPYRTSHPSSLEDARAVVEGLAVRSETIDITPMADPAIGTDPEMSALRKGNIMARLRMILLYDRSARDNSLVLGTGNKTEILLGYSTLFGDSACALNPIGDLYKTQVRELAEYLGIPRRIIDKPPSADLWAGQTDEGELGFSYAAVDELLYFLVDERMTREELLAQGFEERFIARVQEMIRKSQYKRMPPIVAKIGYRTTNIDFRYARDWGS